MVLLSLFIHFKLQFYSYFTACLSKKQGDYCYSESQVDICLLLAVMFQVLN